MTVDYRPSGRAHSRPYANAQAKTVQNCSRQPSIAIPPQRRKAATASANLIVVNFVQTDPLLSANLQIRWTLLYPNVQWVPAVIAAAGSTHRRCTMDTTTLLIIILIVILLGGGGWYGRGRWY
jgi:hypothetical protein